MDHLVTPTDEFLVVFLDFEGFSALDIDDRDN